jgi:hypothetical protein
MVMSAVIREAMRLYPPVPARLVVPREDTTVLNGKYALKKDAWMVVQTMSAQRDPKVWGENVSRDFLTALWSSLTISRLRSSDRRGCWGINLISCQ